MIRYAFLAAAACLSSCAESPPPAMHVDGEVIERAVQHAQAQADSGRGGQDVSLAAVAREFGR